jgi:hypothetical protein
MLWLQLHISYEFLIFNFLNSFFRFLMGKIFAPIFIYRFFTSNFILLLLSLHIFKHKESFHSFNYDTFHTLFLIWVVFVNFWSECALLHFFLRFFFYLLFNPLLSMFLLVNGLFTFKLISFRVECALIRFFH